MALTLALTLTLTLSLSLTLTLTLRVGRAVAPRRAPGGSGRRAGARRGPCRCRGARRSRPARAHRVQSSEFTSAKRPGRPTGHYLREPPCERACKGAQTKAAPRASATRPDHARRAAECGCSTRRRGRVRCSRDASEPTSCGACSPRAMLCSPCSASPKRALTVRVRAGVGVGVGVGLVVGLGMWVRRRRREP